MNYIIDSCVWIDYFRNKINFKEISQLLIDNLVLTNKIILSELIPSAMVNKEYDFIDCLSGIDIVPLDIDWDEIIGIQYQCIKTGINKLGLLDIVIAQNAKQNNIEIFSTDKHMILLSKKMGINCRIK
jgi:predicted nucleic acid-binding protein